MGIDIPDVAGIMGLWTVHPREPAMLTPHQEWARSFAVHLRRIGYNPLPSREYDDQTPEKERRKQPVFKYADLWEKLAPEEWFTRDGWPPTGSLQCMTGRFWKLAVIDLDGPEAIDEWNKMGGVNCPKTWISHSGGGGRHLWFTLPDGLPPMGQVFLWRGNGEHQNVEFLCDKRLIMVPPSIHPATGRQYKWLNRSNMPNAWGLGKPALIPNWVLEKVVETHAASKGSFRSHAAVAAVRRPSPAPHFGERFPSRDELLATADKIGLASRWGVRFTGRVAHRPTGTWHECRAIDHEDNNPSAAVNAESGVYVDMSRNVTLSFFDLLIELGAGKDFREVASLISGAR